MGHWKKTNYFFSNYITLVILAILISLLYCFKYITFMKEYKEIQWFYKEETNTMAVEEY